MDKDEYIACPCCGFKTIADEEQGSYQMCEICWWEDFPDDLANPCTAAGGPNHRSLHETQQRMLKKFPLSVTEYKGYSRCQKWRPLNQAEIDFYKRGLSQGEIPYWKEDSNKSK